MPVESRTEPRSGGADQTSHQFRETFGVYAQAVAVIVGTGYGYRRPDGVLVIPIGALRP